MKSIHQDYQLLSIMLPLGGAARRPPGCYLRCVDTVEILIRSDCGLDIILSVAFYTQIANYISKYNRKNKLSTISYFILPFLNKKKKQFNSLCRNAALSVAVTYRNLLSINVGIYAINKPHLAGVGVPGVECPQTISAKSTIN